jgi:hypothetical protein
MINAYSVLVVRTGPLGTLRCSWEDNIRMDLKKLGWEGVDWINVAHDRT